MSVRKGVWLDCKEGWGVGAVRAAQGARIPRSRPVFLTFFFFFFFLPMAILCQAVISHKGHRGMVSTPESS